MKELAREGGTSSVDLENCEYGNTADSCSLDRQHHLPAGWLV